MLTLVPRRIHPSCYRPGLIIQPSIRPVEKEEDKIVRRLKWLAAARLQAQYAFERGVHESETIQADLDSALQQGEDDLARRLIQALWPVSLERDALGRQVEILDRESKALRARLSQLRRLCPSPMEFSTGPEFAEQWLDAELLKRKAALQDTLPEDV